MTPVSRRDAILAEADEAPAEVPAGGWGAVAPGARPVMPELPEVETVARDLRGLVVGARITGVRVSWLRTLRSQDPEAFARRVVGRTIVGTSRRAKLVVARPPRRRHPRDHDPPQDDRPAVRGAAPASPTIRTSASCWSSRTGASCGSATSGSSAGSGWRRGPASTATSGRARRVEEVQGLRAGAARSGVHRAGVPARFARPEGPAQAAPAGPGLPGRRRQHLRRRGAVGGAAASAAIREVAPPGRRGPALPRHSRGSSPRRSSGAARRSTTTRRPRATAPCRSELLVYQRAGEPCARCGRPIRRIVIGGALDALLLVVPAPAGRASARARRRSCGGWSRDRAPEPAPTGPRWTEIGGGDGSLGTRPGRRGARRARAGSRARARPNAASGGDPPRGRARRRRATRALRRRRRRRRGLMSILRLEGIHREVGTFVILDRIDAAIALGDRIGLVGPNGAGKTTLLRIAAGLDEPDGGAGRAQARPVDRHARPGGASRRRVHGRARRPDGGAPRRGAARGDGGRARGDGARRASDGARLRDAAASVRGARRVHAGPARRRGAVRPRLQRARMSSAAVVAVGRRADAGRRWPDS